MKEADLFKLLLQMRIFKHKIDFLELIKQLSFRFWTKTLNLSLNILQKH